MEGEYEIDQSSLTINFKPNNKQAIFPESTIKRFGYDKTSESTCSAKASTSLENPIPVDEEDIFLFKNALYVKYRYRLFDLGSILNDAVFIGEFQPSQTQIENFIDALIKDKILFAITTDSIRKVKFNISLPCSSDNSYLSHDYIVNFIANRLSSYGSQSIHQMRKALKYEKRPTSSNWKNYIRDLVSDSFFNETDFTD